MIGADTGHKGGNVREVPADAFITQLAHYFESQQSLSAPKWADLVKTGSQKEMPANFQNWWVTRAASVARQVYLHPGTTVTQLRNHYGTNKDNGSAPPHFCKSGGKIIREVLRQLEQIKWVTSDDEGRSVTPIGQKQLDLIAQEVKRSLD